ncbi:MAG: RNA polymerase sigma factor, partial [Gemmatimonadota bacterium]|nr:RNA polymerase sigma factor [Gemmatimonadota bacterium]
MDDALVEAARRGDPEARGALVERHYEVVYRTALSMVSQPDLASDVAQDAFLKAFRGLNGFRGDAAFRTWLLTITGNEARGVLRKRQRRRETSLEDAGPVVARGPSPETEISVSDEAARARRFLERLPEKQRLCVALRIDEGMSFKEIGEVIGSSEGAAR